MRTSPAMIYKNYLKKSNDESEDSVEEETTQAKAKATSTPKTNNIKLTPQQAQEYKNNRLEYYKQYYASKKEQLLERAKVSDKANYWRRIVRELRQNKKNYKDMKPETIEKYKIEFDKKRNEYISLIDPDY